MKRKVFYSFDYESDCVRAQMIRHIGVVERNPPVSGNDREAVKRGGDKAIQKWIDEQLKGSSCTIVLIGQHTTQSKWVKYEIKKSWDDGRGVFVIYIHRLKNFAGEQTPKGKNPLAHVTIRLLFFFEQKLSDIVKAYEPPHHDSQKVYKHISDNILEWIDEAISIREQN